MLLHQSMITMMMGCCCLSNSDHFRALTFVKIVAERYVTVSVVVAIAMMNVRVYDCGADFLKGIIYRNDKISLAGHHNFNFVFLPIGRFCLI